MGADMCQIRIINSAKNALEVTSFASFLKDT